MLHATWIAIFNNNPFTSDFDMKNFSAIYIQIEFWRKTNIVFNFCFQFPTASDFFLKDGISIFAKKYFSDRIR